MTKIMKKRQLIMAVLVVALAAAVFVNWYYTKPQTTPVSGQEPMTEVDAEETVDDIQAVDASDASEWE